MDKVAYTVGPKIFGRIWTINLGHRLGACLSWGVDQIFGGGAREVGAHSKGVLEGFRDWCPFFDFKIN